MEYELDGNDALPEEPTFQNSMNKDLQRKCLLKARCLELDDQGHSPLDTAAPEPDLLEGLLASVLLT